MGLCVAPRARGGAPDQLGGPGPGLEGAGAEEGGRGGGRKPEAAAAPAPETWQALRVHPRDSLIWGGVAFSAWLNLQLCLRHQEGTDFPNHRHPSRFRGWGGRCSPALLGSSGVGGGAFRGILARLGATTGARPGLGSAEPRRPLPVRAASGEARASLGASSSRRPGLGAPDHRRRVLIPGPLPRCRPTPPNASCPSRSLPRTKEPLSPLSALGNLILTFLMIFPTGQS
jgi:hypothetical protein